MKIELELTEIQEAAVSRLNQQSNPDGKTELADFVPSLLAGYLDDLVAKCRTADLGVATEKLQAVADKLTAEDLAALSALADKHSK